MRLRICVPLRFIRCDIVRITHGMSVPVYLAMLYAVGIFRAAASGDIALANDPLYDYIENRLVSIVAL